MSADGWLARLWTLLDPAPGGVPRLHERKWMLSEARAPSVHVDRGNAPRTIRPPAADPVSRHVSEHRPPAVDEARWAEDPRRAASASAAPAPGDAEPPSLEASSGVVSARSS